MGFAPEGIAFTPDGKLAYVTNQGGSVSVIDTATKTVIATIPTGALAINVSITLDGKFAYVTVASAGGPVEIINVATNQIVGSIPFGGGRCESNRIVSQPEYYRGQRRTTFDS